MSEQPLVSATGLTERYAVRTRTRRRTLTAVDGVDLRIEASRLIDGQDLDALGPARLRRVRRDIQPIFQDPYDSLDGRQRVGTILEEPARVHGIDPPPGRSVPELLDLVNLAPDYARRFPHEVSGGQRQRVAIARAVALDPKFVVCDEPVTALGVSMRAQVVNLLRALQRDLGLAYHPYTQLLLASVPRPRVDARRSARPVVAMGALPGPLDRPSGCVFSSRCPLATDRCREETPMLRTLADGHDAACHYAETAQVVA